MKSIYVLGIAVFAVFALSAGTASLAFASEYEWLVAGKAVTTEAPSEATGEIKLEELETGLSVLCSGIFDGLLLPAGKDTIESVLTLAGELLTSDLIECTAQALCETSMEVDVIPLHLPWATELSLTAAGALVDLIFSSGAGTPGYEIKCLTIIGEETGSCEGASAPEQKNATGGVEAIFEENDTGTCTFSKAATGDIKEGKGLTTSTSGEVAITENG